MEQKNQILTSVAMKCAAEICDKGAKPEDLMEIATTIFNMHTAWLERLKNKTNESIKS